VIAGRQRANFFENGIRNRRLARACTADNQDVLVGNNGLLNDLKVIEILDRVNEVFLL
jgi:hypothetical protein